MAHLGIFDEVIRLLRLAWRRETFRHKLGHKYVSFK